jgi:TRAP-type C4-dicarboxylate transport system permease small subunit
MKLKKIIDTGIPILCGVLLAGILGLTFWQVVLRNCFSGGMNWSDEVSQFFMTWLVLFGSIWASKNNQHLKTGFKLHEKLNKRLIHIIDSILDLLLIIVGVVTAYQTTIFTLERFNTTALSLLWMKMGYVFIMMPLAMLGLAYYSLKDFLKNLASIFKID